MHQPNIGYSTPPHVLVEGGVQHLGRFDAPVARANLLDAKYRGLPRPLRWLRLKEWQALQIATPKLFVNLALFDAKLMSLLQAKVYDRVRGEKHAYERKLRPGALKIADNLLDSSNRYEDRRGWLGFDNRVGEGRIDVDFELPATTKAPRLAGKLIVHVAQGASQVVSLPFEHGGMYSHKGMFPISGTLTVGDDTHHLADDGALALLDDHKGYYPYVMKWDWVTGAYREPGGRALGVNLTRNQCREPDTYNENCAWIDDQIGVLPAVTFERDGARWRIRDRDGRVDVTFTETVPGDVRVNVVVVESRYRGPFGTLEGTVAPEGLPAIRLDGWFGMGEEFWLRC